MAIKAIIFDFGNVVINIDVSLTYQNFAALSGKSYALIEQAFVKNEIFKHYETGLYNSEEFRDIIRQIIGFQFTDNNIDAAFNALLLDIPKDRIAYLKKLRQKYPIYLLSNTNITHIKAANKYLQSTHQIENIETLFDKVFLSYELARWKPDPEIYQMVLNDLNLLAHEVLFLDDNQANISSAKSMGINSILITPPISFIKHLDEIIIL